MVPKDPEYTRNLVGFSSFDYIVCEKLSKLYILEKGRQISENEIIRRWPKFMCAREFEQLSYEGWWITLIEPAKPITINHAFLSLEDVLKVREEKESMLFSGNFLLSSI